jgi:hypothetical protein
LRNSLRGVLYVLLPAAVLAGWHWFSGDPDDAWWSLVLLAAGAMQGICYEIAWTVRKMEEHPTELGELLTGACMGLGAVLAVVLA